MTVSEDRKKELMKQGYRLVGNHSAIKTCLWCKKAVRGDDTCYKNTFYNIKSWRCIEASVTLDNCNLRCEWCWRDINYSSLTFEKLDDPKMIVDGFIQEHKKLLVGFFGAERVNRERLDESMKPKHVALSLTGDACMYPKLPELIDEIHSREMTTFLVTNGTFPRMLEQLLDGHQPTQLYITLPAPDEKTYEEACKPLTPNTWPKIKESLKLLGKFDRSVIRLTLAKGLNMHNADGYAELLKDVDFDWIEFKAAMPVGYARYRLAYQQMPMHTEIKEFAEQLCAKLGAYIVDEKANSRVVLVARQDREDRKLVFDWDHDNHPIPSQKEVLDFQKKEMKKIDSCCDSEEEYGELVQICVKA